MFVLIEKARSQERESHGVRQRGFGFVVSKTDRVAEIRNFRNPDFYFGGYVSNLTGKTISGRYLIIGAALSLMLASTAHAETPKKDKIKNKQQSVISSSNPITASVSPLSGDAITPGFKSVGTAASLSMGAGTNLILSNPSPVRVLQTAPAVSISSPASISIVNSSLALSGGIQTIPPAVKPVALTQPQIKPDSNLLSPALTSVGIMPTAGLQPLKAPEMSGLTTNIVNANLNSSPLLCTAQSTSQFIFKAEDGAHALHNNISWKNEAHSSREAAEKVLTNNKPTVQHAQALQAGKRTVNALITKATQTCATAKILAQKTHSRSRKTASSVTDGFYAVQKSLSTARVTAWKHIKSVTNLKNKTYEHTSGWIKGIIPIFKLVIPNEDMPLLLDLLLQDSSNLPSAVSGNEHKDPLPAPLRKAFEDRNSGDQNPLSETIARVAWKPINPTHSINIIDMLKKNAVNYTRTGLSPPETVSTNSTAFLSASNRSIRSYSALDVSVYNANLTIDNSIIYNTIPLSSLISGGDQLQDRGIFLCNCLFYQGRAL
ncbi:MAG: hypothetical protein KBC23_02145 [Candidatus Omnitrophica bacterium]|nr:hypothetical protein [Candidatus Omnitrophota bacterium]